MKIQVLFYLTFVFWHGVWNIVGAKYMFVDSNVLVSV